MKRSVTTYTAMCLVFLLLLSVAGAFDGIISEVIYYLSFVLPTILGILANKKLKDEESAHDREYKEPENIFALEKEKLKLFLPLIFPTVLVIFLISALSAALIGSLFGAQSAVDVGDSLPVALLVHALLPAIFEELLFRIMPIKMLARYSARLTVIISSLYFALVHNSFFSIPYALFAGAVFMCVDLLCDSVIPSLVMHFVNNAISILWMFYSGDTKFAVALPIILVILSLISVIPVIINKDKYISELKRAFAAGDGFKLGAVPLAVAVPTLFLAITELL